jgi:hypothetical protein
VQRAATLAAGKTMLANLVTQVQPTLDSGASVIQVRDAIRQVILPPAPVVNQAQAKVVVAGARPGALERAAPVAPAGHGRWAPVGLGAAFLAAVLALAWVLYRRRTRG